MAGLKPVTVSSNAFAFCKFSIASLLWVSILFQSKVLLIVVILLLILSAIVKVQKAPLILLYTHTVDRLIPSKEIVIEENSIWFAHTVGAIMAMLGFVILEWIHPVVGWGIVGILAFLKTTASFGFCGAAKLYTCMNNPNGKCCRTGLFARRWIGKSHVEGETP